MVINYSILGKVMFTMIEYIKGMLNDLPKDMDGWYCPHSSGVVPV